jgi:muramoyltetrapeptide carboxypeptidase
MRTPPPLKAGDKIGITATARKITREELQAFEKWLTEKGYVPEYSKHLFAQNHQFAGSDQDRAEAFVALWNDPEVKAIWCARGGYGTARMLPLISKHLNEARKWIIGFSDVTALLQSLNNQGVMGLHASMSLEIDKKTNESVAETFRLLEGGKMRYAWGSHPLNQRGEADGILSGGNLSVLYSLRGTNYDLDPEGKILFLEDLDEYLYHIDRMCQNLSLAQWWRRLSGVVVGGMTDMRDNVVPFGKNAEEIIASHVQEVIVPVAFGFSAGHLPHNLPLKMGATVRLTVNEKESKLEEI